MKNKILKIGYYIFIAIIVGIAVLLAVSLFPISGNYKVKVVLSGSMDPAIKKGSIVVIKPVDLYKIDDVITFGKDTRTDIPITHRIVESHAVNGKMLYKTKGDANNDVDLEEVRESKVIGKVLFSVPYLGYLIDFAKKPIGFFFLIAVPLVIIIFDEAKKIRVEIKKMRKNKVAGDSVSSVVEDENIEFKDEYEKEK